MAPRTLFILVLTLWTSFVRLSNSAALATNRQSLTIGTVQVVGDILSGPENYSLLSGTDEDDPPAAVYTPTPTSEYRHHATSYLYVTITSELTATKYITTFIPAQTVTRTIISTTTTTTITSL
ncbi:hypothetical protein QBC44DRAFT_374818, partial [Cladorrhinum sp. PSN332]